MIKKTSKFIKSVLSSNNTLKSSVPYGLAYVNYQENIVDEDDVVYYLSPLDCEKMSSIYVDKRELEDALESIKYNMYCSLYR